MDHPLRGDNYKELRKRVVSLLENGFSIQRQSNIVFVCGGNDANHMRKRFQSAFPALLPDYEYFEPEFAMTNYLSFDDPTPFDIAEFEELIGALSHSIVLFPEGAGSCAELGYFSAKNELAEKIALVLDAPRQKTGSFISLGPAKRIASVSRFQQSIQIDYENPDFSIISERIKEMAPLSKNRRNFSVAVFSKSRSKKLLSRVNLL
jgi:hypothetical protein